MCARAFHYSGAQLFQSKQCSEFVFLLRPSQREWCAHDGGIRKGEKDTPPPPGQCHPQNICSNIEM